MENLAHGVIKRDGFERINGGKNMQECNNCENCEFWKFHKKGSFLYFKCEKKDDCFIRLPDNLGVRKMLKIDGKNPGLN